MAQGRVIVISPRDNVATALDPLAAGTSIDVDGRTILVLEAIAAAAQDSFHDIPIGEDRTEAVVCEEQLLEAFAR